MSRTEYRTKSIDYGSAAQYFISAAQQHWSKIIYVVVLAAGNTPSW